MTTTALTAPDVRDGEVAVDRLPVATRVHAVPVTHAAPAGGTPRGPRPPTRPPRRPDDPDQPRALLVFDTETLVDHTQALTFGVWRYYERTPLGWVCREEGLFHADDLADTDPVGFAVLQRVAATAQPAVDRGHGSQRMRLLSRSAFVEKVLFTAAWKDHARVVGFNLPFDLSRLAIDVADGRGRNYGGFSLTLAAGNAAKGYTERRHRPRVQIKHLNSHRAQISFSAALGAPQRWSGDFVDLRTLTFALTGNGYTLDSACAAFGVPGKADPGGHGTITPAYVAYCRQDVAATAELYIAAEKRLIELGIRLTAPYAYSPASLAKALLDSCGIRPVLDRHPDTDPTLLGIAMSAFYGGRAECHVRRTPVPIRLVDFTSTYPTLLALLDVWSFIVADRIDAEDSPDTLAEMQALLDQVSVDGCFDPSFYPKLVGFAQIVPADDILPVRAQYDPQSPAWGIGSNYFTSAEPGWYALPDLVASTLLTGRAPRLVRAIRLVPLGQADGLREVTLPGGRRLDPRTENPFTVMTELRQVVRRDGSIPEAVREGRQLFFKIASNAGGFGIWAEYNSQDLPQGTVKSVTVNTGTGDPFDNKVHAPEEPGRYCYPPLAAVITAAGRLLLALIERCVTDLGGTHAVADTDSMAIVATKAGGLIPCPGGALRLDGADAVLALSYAQVDQIRDRFTALNPYAQTAVPGTILKSEVDALCYAIAAKRYALFRYDQHGLPRLVDAGEHATCRHGLGHLLNPVDPDDDPDGQNWIVQLWEYELAIALTPELAGAAPDWHQRPALSRIAATSPYLLRAFEQLNGGKTYARQVKPFNFLMFAPGARAPARNTDTLRLVAPYARRRHWKRLGWIDLHHPDSALRLSTDPAEPGTALQDTYATIAGRYLTHPERKSAQHRQPGRPHTTGLLERRHVGAGSHSYLGKEANQLDQRESGQLTVDEFAQHQLAYRDTNRGSWESIVLPRLKTLAWTELHRTAGVSDRRLHDILSGKSYPRPDARQRLWLLATRAPSSR